MARDHTVTGGMRVVRPTPAAFTLIELLAVIAIILLLVSLLIPAAFALRGKSSRSVCMSNMRQLQLGYNLATMDRNGRLPSSDTSSGYGKPEGDWWTGTSDLTLGCVWPFVKNAALYSCPSYPVPAREQLKRHYSLSTRIGSTSGGTAYELAAMSQVKRPSRTHVLIEEYDNRSVASGPSPGAVNGFLIGLTGSMIDCPPTWHDMGANFSFLDGHVEYRHWIGPKMRTVDCYTWFYGQYAQNWPTTAADADDWFYMISGVTNAFF